MLLSTLGGLTVFGISGLLIGPMIAALFLAVWDMFAQEPQDGHPAAESQRQRPGETRKASCREALPLIMLALKHGRPLEEAQSAQAVHVCSQFVGLILHVAWLADRH